MNTIPEKEPNKSNIQRLFERVLMAMVFSCLLLDQRQSCLPNQLSFGGDILEPFQIERMYNKERRLQLINNRYKYRKHDMYQEGMHEIPPNDIPLIPLVPIPPYLPGQHSNLEENVEIKTSRTKRVA